MNKRRNTTRKKIDIYQKSFSFTHRYNKEKFAFEKITSLKNSFDLKINNRLILSAIVFSSLFLAVAIKIIEINLFHPEKHSYFVKNTGKERVNILDRNGTSLTANLLTSDISVNPKAVHDKNKFIKKVVTLDNNLNKEKLESFISQDKFFWLKRNADPGELQKYIDIGETGIEFRDAYKRKYLHSELFSHVLGEVDIDNIGISGIEKSFENYLKSNTNDDLVLSFDSRAQHIVRDEILSAMKIYEATGGSGLIINVNNGEIIAMTSLPDFDPNASYEQIADKMRPINKFNRNTLGVYEFGSVMKIFTTAIGIEENIFHPNSKYEIGDFIYIDKHRVEDDHRPCERMACSVEEIFVESSNIGTINMIRDIGKDIQHDYLAKLGLLSRVQLDIPETGNPIIPNPWRTVNSESISYGYGLSVSPLHLAIATSAVVNGGFQIRPSIIKLNVDEKYEEQIFSKETSELMRYLLSQVVAKGTAKEAFSKNADKAYIEKGEHTYIVGGKTGTSYKIDKKSYATSKLTTFVSVFPIHKPKYLVLVSLDDPKGVNKDYGDPYNTWNWSHAGWNAARVSRQIIDRVSPIFDIKTRYLSDENLLIKTSLQ